MHIEKLTALLRKEHTTQLTVLGADLGSLINETSKVKKHIESERLSLLHNHLVMLGNLLNTEEWSTESISEQDSMSWLYQCMVPACKFNPAAIVLMDTPQFSLTGNIKGLEYLLNTAGLLMARLAGINKTASLFSAENNVFNAAFLVQNTSMSQTLIEKINHFFETGILPSYSQANVWLLDDFHSYTTLSESLLEIGILGLMGQAMGVKLQLSIVDIGTPYAALQFHLEYETDCQSKVSSKNDNLYIYTDQESEHDMAFYTQLNALSRYNMIVLPDYASLKNKLTMPSSEGDNTTIHASIMHQSNVARLLAELEEIDSSVHCQIYHPLHHDNASFQSQVVIPYNMITPYCYLGKEVLMNFDVITAFPSKGEEKDKCVLILEDNAHFFEAFRTFFSDIAEVVHARTVKEACRYINADNPVDLIISDLRLEDGETGYDFIEKRPLRARSIKTVACSALQDEKDRAVSSGFDDFLLKPLSATHVRALKQQLQHM